jgi:hypothetical protein
MRPAPKTATFFMEILKSQGLSGVVTARHEVGDPATIEAVARNEKNFLSFLLFELDFKYALQCANYVVGL